MNDWKNRNAFVTGATGFVGSHLVRHLVEKGAKVVCLQRDVVEPNPLDLLKISSKVTVINGDLLDSELMKRVLNEYQIDAVFHLAAQTLVGIANRSPFSTFESNLRGTYTLLEACRMTPSIRSVVVASSDKAYGTQEELPYREDQSLLGLFPYDASKACTDIISRSYAKSYDLPVTVTRFANIYGPADLNLSRVIPGTILSVLKGERPIIRSDGTPRRDFLYVDDAAEAYMMLSDEIDRSKGEPFNFGGGEPVRILDLVLRILDLTGSDLEPDVLLKNKIEGEIDSQYLGLEKVSDFFDWKPRVDLDQGLTKTIEWYRANLEELS